MRGSAKDPKEAGRATAPRPVLLADRPAPLTLASVSPRPAPIFIHSSFRAASTWLWSKFRAAPNTMAYFEIFHERLAIFEPRTINTDTNSTWRSNHPASAPYFLEYLPLLQASGGVPGYEVGMAFERFVPADGLDGHLSAQEASYVELLVRHAHANRKVPVLTCTRTLGRMKALGRAFPGQSVFLHRNIFHQWASYSRLAIDGNTYFIETVDKILKGSRHDPLLRAIDDWFFARTVSPYDESMFLAFLLVHFYLYAHAYDAADLAVDVTALAGDADLRRTVEDALSTMAGSRIDLSDARSDFEVSVVDVRSPSEFTDTIDQFMKLIAGTCATESSVAFVESIKDSALAEWRRHEFFTRHLRSVHAEKLADVTRQLEKSEARHAALAAERDAREAVGTAPRHGSKRGG